MTKTQILKLCFIVMVPAVLIVSATGYTAWRINKDEKPILKVRITTDKSHYNIGQTVRIKIKNHGTKKTYVWIGSCSLTLEWHNGNTWETIPISWSGCLSGPDCGIQREIPEPRFLSPEATEEIKWNQIVAWCKKGTIIKEEPAVGRFRFVFRYAEDELGCRSTPDPFMCWLNYRNKKWHSAYSNEFTIREHGDL